MMVRNGGNPLTGKIDIEKYSTKKILIEAIRIFLILENN
ncbi:MAG: hypothetical protein ACJAWO_000834 [Halieaceae bacterium]|jgi:hypothetical protein